LARIIRLIDRLTLNYIKSQIETGDPARTKKALQQLCEHYRDGGRSHPDQLIGLEQSLIGLLYTQANDEKVRRWALNALARLGREPTCMEAIMHTFQQYTHEPQTTAAAIAAIYRMSRMAAEILRTLSFDEQMLTLAALQHVDSNNLDLSALPIDVETASPDLLKLALVVVGLDKAPNNMLHPHHENAELVQALGAHHDDVVSQYSVWAITENDSLTLKNLGINLKNIEQQPANVRSWIFRLIAMTPEDAERHFEYLQLGMNDPHPDARTGLAIGLKEIYFDGLEAIVLDWFTSEIDADVRQHLLDHMIRQADSCPSYGSMALEIYEKEPHYSSSRQRMEAAAAGTSLFGKFKRADDSNDLFRVQTNVTHNIINVKGDLQGGAISLGGSAQNLGATSVHYNPQTVQLIQSELSKAERELHTLGVDLPIKREALKALEAAKSDPTPDRMAKVISSLSQVQTVIEKVANTAAAGVKIAEAISKLGGLL
jgi:hypothetical protein